jgi:excisionase family DNA binding protein
VFTLKKIFELPEIMSVKDVQEYLNLSKTTVYRLFNEDDFPSMTIGSSKRVAKEDFLNWLNQKKLKGDMNE